MDYLDWIFNVLFKRKERNSNYQEILTDNEIDVVITLILFDLSSKRGPCASE